MCSSIKKGVSFVKTDSFFISLGDMPLIGPEIYNCIYNESKKNKEIVIMPYYKNNPGHPVLIPSKLIDLIKNCKNNITMRELILNLPYKKITLKSKNIYSDIDCNIDYKKLTKQVQ